MSDNVENLILEHLKSFQATLDRVEVKVGDLTTRMSNVESGQVMLMQHLTHLDAAQQLGIDRLSERLDSIERRLELTS